MKRLLAALLPLVLAPAMGWAACSGQDLRKDLSAEAQQEIAQRMDHVPFAEGNHWIAKRGDRQIHLIGTVHISSDKLQRITQNLGPVIDSADVLLLESTPQEIADMQTALVKDPSLTFITEGPTLIDRLPAGDWAILSQKASEAGIPSWMAAKMRPWFLATALSLPPCLRADPEVEYGLDKRLAAMAQASEVPTQSLENPLDVIRMLDRDPIDEQLRQMRPYIALIGGSESGEDGIATMLAAYFEERVAEYLEITRLEFLSGASMPTKEAETIWNDFMGRLLKERNTAWMPVIEAQTADHMVIAVGALHLPGKHGLLQLLSDTGYKIERAAF
ncbi:TraB/GumN family protein [Epibacterium sp. SM1979]|uniref:TraB/GumN family protein n=1 Tax=Tritonibacter litoralis TaxID=2662264 RepID=A0A843Y9Q1_9RHOB|nr:TraB/GumN family protein [Tritonibacter litoralis]MQQ08000.1 TraB/GumN family protein [Tritonibacter litoralis]